MIATVLKKSLIATALLLSMPGAARAEGLPGGCGLVFALDEIAAPVSAQAGIVDEKLKQYPLLKKGTKPDFLPKTFTSEKTAGDILADLIAEEPQTLIVADSHNYELYRERFAGRIVRVEINSFEEANRIVSDPSFRSRTQIVGIGAGAALDTAKAVAVFGQRLTVVPTLLSTNCHTSNRTVLGKGFEALSYLAGTPERVILPINDLLAQPRDTLRYWTSAGISDYLAGVSARIDHQYRAAPEALSRIRLADLRAEPSTKEAFEATEWFAANFDDYNRTTLLKFDEYSNVTGFQDIEYASNVYRIGSEHSFYHATNELFPHLRTDGPAHGHIVAWGTLLNTYAFGRYTGDFTLYNQVQNVMKRIGVPTDLAGIQKMGLTRDQMLAALQHIPKPPFKDSVMGKFILELGPETLLRSVFPQ